MSASADIIATCPCCKNPWAAATGELFAQLCDTCAESGKDDNSKKNGAAAAASLRSHMDFGVAPSQNFYQYAAGAWMRNNPIPPGYPSWNTFQVLRVQSQERLKAVLDDLIASSSSSSNGTTKLTVDQAKVAAFYSAALDEEAIEREGTAPLQVVLDLIEETIQESDGSKRASLLGQFPSRFGLFPFFRLSASPDHKRSTHTVAQLSQGGLGLPDRDYYFDADKAEKREVYLQHVARMLTLLQDPTAAAASTETAAPASEAARTAAQQVYDMELRLAEAHMTKAENRDPEATYNKMSVAELSEQCRGQFDFAAYLESACHGKDLGEAVNVRNMAAIQRVAHVVSTADESALRSYLRWRAVGSLAPYLSRAFVREHFDFYERCLSGTAEIKPRWKRAMEFTESALGEVLGQLYCEKYFDEACKDRAVAIVENVRRALENRLKEVEWMKAEATRENALKKMAGFRVKIGFPDKWIDYTPLKIEEGDSFLEMVFKAEAFDHQRTVDEMNAPTDREKWFMTPQTVNAYYHPSLNEIVFPAAILQPPFFDASADDALNYGAMGAVVGHEMTHGFDDKGRKFNYEGNMLDWWTAEDAEEYEKRVEVMVEQANAFQVHGASVQGKLTCGENIADLGGLRLALRALRATAGFDDTVQIDGFTPTQRFFLGWAQCWRQNVTKERALQLLTIDPHGPNEMRCNGPLSNIAEFHAAFGVLPNSPLFRPVEERVDIW